MSKPSSSNQREAGVGDVNALQRAVAALEKMKARLDSVDRAANEPIAVVGMGCRFPGGSDDLDALWQALESGVDAIGEISPKRWPSSAVPEHRQEARWAALLDDVSTFDASFFGISPREAEALDPQQRMLLEVTWHALEDAAIRTDSLPGSRTGVFIGISSIDYQLLMNEHLSKACDAYTATGTIHSTAAGRISFVLGLQGPAISLDTACSSSLVAVAQACQSLRSGDCNLALAGGVNAILSPQAMAMLLETQALSPDGRCKALDARANGFVRGEGCGVVVLKRLSDALRDGDRIRALIKGWAVNQDGRSTGLTAPNVISQQLMLRQALERARLSPEDIGYVEMHGTGTSLGDPIEAEALKEVLGNPRSDGSSCVLGAIKTNLGHLEAAAGVAGFIKTVLTLEHERIPRNLHFKRLNPRISFDGTPFIIPTENVPWPRGNKTRRAGVSSFGLSGTNAHVILEESPKQPVQQQAAEGFTYLLPISAKAPNALSSLATAYAQCLNRSETLRLSDVVHSASLRRDHFPHRLAAVAQNREELARMLDSFGRGETTNGIVHGEVTQQQAPRNVFVFSGQGSQWAGMGKQLLDEEPVFRAKLEEIDALVRKYASFSLLTELRAAEAESRLGETEIAQPALFALQVGLAELFKSWGIIPKAVIGHSVGEVAASHVCGALALDEAVRLVILRGRIMQKATGRGKMAWAALSAADATQALAGYEEEVSIAAINDPASCVLSGETVALDSLLEELAGRSISTRPLRVNYAFHSPQMAPLARELSGTLGPVTTKQNDLPMYSTVTGQPIDSSMLTTSYWSRNVRATVNFNGAIAAALRDGHQLFIEIAPHPVLSANIEQCVAAANANARVIPTLRRQYNERRGMLESMGALYVGGVDIDWNRFCPSDGRAISLPKYPFQRRRYWFEQTDAAIAKPQDVCDPVQDLLYALSWVRKDLAMATKAKETTRGRWLLLLDRNGLGATLADALDKQYQTCVRVHAGPNYSRMGADHFQVNPASHNDFRRLLDDAFDDGSPCLGVVCLFALNATSWADCTEETLVSDFEALAGASLHLTHAIVRKVWRSKPRLCWITQGGQAAPGIASMTAPAQASLWGMTRSFVLEHPGLDILRVDVDPAANTDVSRLIAELEAGDVDDQVALRADGRFVARLVRSQHSETNTAAIEISPDATYLVTEGASRRGLVAARWLVGRGAKYIAITSSHDLTSEQLAQIHAMEQTGAQVILYGADVSRFSDAMAVIGTIESTLPPLRGVLVDPGHERGDAVESDISTLTQASLPRMLGTWNMHRATQSKTLDFFVCFSSASSILGLVGQGGYAAGNAFMDAVAQWRRERALPSLSVQWGFFIDDDPSGQQTARDGLTPGRGIDALERIVRLPHNDVAAMQFSARHMLETFPHLAQSPFLEKLLAESQSSEPAKGAQPAQFRRALEAVPKSARFALLVDHLQSQIGHVLHIDASAIDANVPFQTIGVDSLMSLEVRNRIEATLGLKLPATLLFTYTNVRLLAENLLEQLELPEEGAVVQEITATVEPQSAIQIPDEPIAIVGMACRFPAASNDPETFWRALLNGVDAVVETSPSRWPAGTFSDMQAGVGYAALVDDIDKFDAGFFGISPREAEALDPQQRMLLEVVWNALEDSGIRPDRLVGSKTGVFVGSAGLDYQRLVLSQPNHLDAYGVTGTMLATAAGRLSYVFGLQGPAIAVDTACSSSLVTIHLGCQSLRNHESDLVLAGGANALLSPDAMVAMANMRALSPDGRCKTLDSRANGYVRGEGCGIVVLKRLSDAQRDGNRILALVRGSAVNQDGRSTGLTAPNVLAQQELLRQALASAHLTAQDVGYVEMHGTGTPLGDPIETDALREVFGQPRNDGTQCVLGAVKTNIGHLEGAAGVASVIKVVQALTHETIPRNLHFRALNPRISIDNTPLKIPTENLQWSRTNKPRIAGVSSFGLSGTNAHILIEEPHFEETTRHSQARGMFMLPISAKTPAALLALAKSYGRWLIENENVSPYDVAYTASEGRAHHNHRLAAVASTPAELGEILSAHAEGKTSPQLVTGIFGSQSRPKVVFVFPGQGSQWLGMGKQLYEQEPAFRAVLEACDRAIQSQAGFSILAELHADESNSRLGEIDILQPLLFSLEVALAGIWNSWGIVPACVIGHSMGEVAAAHVAGMLSLEDAVTIICQRSKLLRRIRGQGAMALVELTMSEAQNAIAGFESQIGVAVSNGPRSTVLSGDPSALEKVLEALEKKGVFCRRVKVDVASHSPQVDPLRDDLIALLANVRPIAGHVPMHSTVTGNRLDEAEIGASYWADNLRQPVRFSQVVQALMKDGHSVFVELSPHPILLPSIEENFEATTTSGVAVGSMRRQNDERRTMLDALSSLYVVGCEIRWANLFPEAGRTVSLPTYPWQRERFWIETSTTIARAELNDGRHPLLGKGMAPASQPQLHIWEQWVSVEHFTYLADHRVHEDVVFPGAGYVELALAAGNEVSGDNAVTVHDITFDQMLVLPHGGQRLVQVSLLEAGDNQATITIASRAANEKDWTKHAAGVLQFIKTHDPIAQTESPQTVERRCNRVLTGTNHYEQMLTRGLSYGKTFQGITQLHLGNAEVIAKIDLPTEVADALAYQLHPALLDACFQASGWALHGADDGTFVPVKVTGLRVYEKPKQSFWIHAQIVRGSENSVSLRAIDEDGRVLLQIHELKIQRLANTNDSQNDALSNCVFDRVWRRLDVATSTDVAKNSAPASWIVLADHGAIARSIMTRMRTLGHACVEVVAGIGYAQLEANRYQLDPTSVEQWSTLLASVCAKRPCNGIIDCAPLDGATWSQTTDATLRADLRRGVLTALRLVQAVLLSGFVETPRLYVLTRAAQTVGAKSTPVSVSQATLWGFGQSLAMEHPDVRSVRIDLAPETFPGETDAIVNELLSASDEDQIALQPEGRYVARLVRSQFQDDDGRQMQMQAAAGRPFRLGISEPGVLERLALYPMTRQDPAPGEIEIEVHSSGLNFLDVLKAMGIYPGMDPKAVAFGGEIAGKVVTIGPGVRGFHVGQEVIAVAPSGFATHVTVRADFVAPKPSRLSMEEASTISAVFMTVYWAVHHVAKLERGERILIHSATGGTGLAAVQYAQAVGAEIYATAGSEEKRAYLRAMGIEHVMDSRSLSFADEIMAKTGGRGVHVVLNSLTGEAATKSLEVLGPYGRFLELGKKDIYQNSRLSLLPFRNSLSYTAIDLAGMSVTRPERFGALLREVIARFEEGFFQPEPLSLFGTNEFQEAFRMMAQAQHIGKIAVRMTDPNAQLRIPTGQSIRIRNDGTYLITGGLGALGQSLAHWLVEQGARSLALMGRSSPNETVKSNIDRWRAAGVTVHHLRADVAHKQDVIAAFNELEHSALPLRGVVHTAGVLADRTVSEMNEEDLFRPMDPKVFGIWNLHEATLSHKLDFFIAYSSASGWFGSPGQTNYAAANTFMDALCQARQATGLPGSSIEWGAFDDVGLAASVDIRGGRVAARVGTGLQSAEGTILFGRVLQDSRPVIGLARLDTTKWVESAPQINTIPFFRELINESSSVGRPAQSVFADEVRKANQDDRILLVENHVLQRVGQVLRLDPSLIDRFATFSSIGMDSLMSLELRNRLEPDFAVKLSATLLFSHPTPAALAAHLLDRLQLTDDIQPAVVEPITAPSAEMEQRVELVRSTKPQQPAAPLDDVEAAIEAKLAALSKYLD